MRQFSLVPFVAFVFLTMIHSVVCYAGRIELMGHETRLPNQTTYSVPKDINYNGDTLYLGRNSVLLFVGGKISNAVIVGNHTSIKAKPDFIFDNCTFLGEWIVKCAYPEWFGAKSDGLSDCTRSLQDLFDFMSDTRTYRCEFAKCDYGEKQFYKISKTVYITSPIKLLGKDSFVSTNSILTYKDNPQSRAYFTDGIAFYIVGNGERKAKTTDVSIRIKTHGKPFFFENLTNLYLHDSYVSTFPSSTVSGITSKTYWYAFQCDRLAFSIFRNVHIDQPIEDHYNSSDGIHLSGQCHDVIIDNVYGQTGDDFIALNTNENTSGNIYNICIKNCVIGKEIPSSNGIRIYGNSQLSHQEGKPQLSVSNVSIKNCYIKTINTPPIYFTNSPSPWSFDDNSHLLRISNFRIDNCRLCSLMEYKSKEIVRFNGVEIEDFHLLNTRATELLNEGDSFIKLEGQNEVDKMIVDKCKYLQSISICAEGRNKYLIDKIHIK